MNSQQRLPSTACRFTADVYVTVLEEMGEAAAVAIADFVPRKARREAA